MSALTDRFELEERLRKPARGEPVWLLANLLPAQGEWSTERYLSLATNQLVEYVDGYLEFPPMPTDSHQAISDQLLDILKEYVRPRRLGTIRYAPLKLRIRPGKYREPDLLFVRVARDQVRGELFWESADLVVEIVSPSDPDHDWVIKKAEYAAAGIPEYWIADPRDKTLTIFTLDAGATEFREAGRWGEGEKAASILLDGLTVEVAKVFECDGSLGQ